MSAEYSFRKTKCILLSHKPFRTSSLIIDCFSGDFGKLNFLVKGFFKTKKYSSFPLQIGEILEIVFIDSRRSEIGAVDIYTASDIDILLIPMFSEMNEFVIFEHFLEFLKLIRTVDEKEHLSIFKLYVNFYDLLFECKAGIKKLFLLYLCELIGLSVLGFFSNVFLCSKCGNKNSKIVYLKSNGNGFLCDKCYEKDALLISESLLSLLNDIYLRNFKPVDLRKAVCEKNIDSGDILMLKKIVLLFGNEIFTENFKSGFFIEAVEDKILNS